MLLAMDGLTYAFGDNSKGQLGLGSANDGETSASGEINSDFIFSDFILTFMN
jgi:hypothetical protein